MASVQAIRDRLATDFAFYAPNALKIRTKSGAMKQFVLNEAQNQINREIEDQLKRTGKVRKIILKGRQQGCSTYIEGRFFWKVTHRCGVRAFILTHEEQATAGLFEMAHNYYRNCPDYLRPTLGTCSAKELNFSEINSGYKIGTARNKAVGRGHTLQYFHGSETAYWPHAQEHAKGILQAVPDQPDTEVIFESTGNGVGNYYHQLWLAAIAGDTEFEPIFVPWFVQSEYRREASATMTLTPEEQTLVKVFGLDRDQLLWRRHKIAELVDDTGDGLVNFMREYPCTANEAFEMSGLQIFIPGHVVGLARRQNESELERIGPKVMACDPAAFGDDRTAIIKRQGRVFYDPESYTKLGPMDVADKIAHILDQQKDIQTCFIDKIGIGLGVYDRLIQLGFGNRVIGVNVAEKAFNIDAYRNKRAELWAKLKAWLVDGPVSIPDREDIAADLSSIQFSYDAHNRLQMEKKEDMRKRGVKSPDFADAMCLTFSELLQEDATSSLVEDLWNPGVSYM